MLIKGAVNIIMRGLYQELELVLFIAINKNEYTANRLYTKLINHER